MNRDFILTIFLTTLLSSLGSRAEPITFAFSGQVDWNYVDVPVGTIFTGTVTYDSEAQYQGLAPYYDWYGNLSYHGYGYVLDELTLTINGETASNQGGSLILDSDNDLLSIYAGPYMTLGGGNNFSSEIAGIFVAGFSFTLSNFINDTLPTNAEDVYGLSGSFGFNRAGGDLYDVNSLANLKVPASPLAQSVPEPGIPILLLIGVLGLVIVRYRAFSQSSLTPA